MGFPEWHINGLDSKIKQITSKLAQAKELGIMNYGQVNILVT